GGDVPDGRGVLVPAEAAGPERHLLRRDAGGGVHRGQGRGVEVAGRIGPVPPGAVSPGVVRLRGTDARPGGLRVRDNGVLTAGIVLANPERQRRGRYPARCGAYPVADAPGSPNVVTSSV